MKHKEVIEKWIEEKAQGIIDLSLMREGRIPLLQDCKDFIRSLVEEIQGVV